MRGLLTTTREEWTNIYASWERITSSKTRAPKGSTDNFFPDTEKVVLFCTNVEIQDTSVRNCNPPEEDQVGATRIPAKLVLPEPNTGVH